LSRIEDLRDHIFYCYHLGCNVHDSEVNPLVIWAMENYSETLSGEGRHSVDVKPRGNGASLLESISWLVDWLASDSWDD